MAEGKSTRLDEHQRSRNRPPKSKKKVSLPSCSRSGLQRLRMLAFFFLIFVRIFGAGWTFWEPFFLLFAVSVAQRSESIVCILSIAVWRGAFCLQSWPNTKFGEEMTGSQWRSSSWSEESWPEVCADDDGNFFVIDREKCLWGCVTKMCTLKNKSFWWTAEERRLLSVKGIYLQKSCLQNFCTKMRAKDCM